MLGYQFPPIVDDEWNSNWLNIRIHAQMEPGVWSATDTSLDDGGLMRKFALTGLLDPAETRPTEEGAGPVSAVGPRLCGRRLSKASRCVRPVSSN